MTYNQTTLPGWDSEACRCANFYPSSCRAFCLLTMTKDQESGAFILPSRSAVKVFLNQGGGISIVGETTLQDPAVIYLEIQDIPKLIAGLRQVVKDAKQGVAQ